MNHDKVYKRVLEIQDNLELSSDEVKVEMLNELLGMVSQIEQSLNSSHLNDNNKSSLFS